MTLVPGGTAPGRFLQGTTNASAARAGRPASAEVDARLGRAREALPASF